MQLWLLALLLLLLLVLELPPPLRPPQLPLIGLLRRPEGPGLFPCGGLLSYWSPGTGLLAEKPLRSAWAPQRSPVSHWAAGHAAQPWESNCPGCGAAGSCWESGNR